MKVYIGSQPWQDGFDFYLISEQHNKRYLLIDNKMCEIKEGEVQSKPSFHLPDIEASELLKSFAEVAAERGIKLESDLKREGKLEATERHLEDLRRLVFKEKK